MRKYTRLCWQTLLLALCLVLGTSAAWAEVTWEDCSLALPEEAAPPEITWEDGAGEPRMVVIAVPEAQRAEVLAAMEAAPDWLMDDAALDRETALEWLRHMACTELPELPEDIAFEGVCFWVEGLDGAEMDDEMRLFTMALCIGAVALNGEETINIPLRMGFYDVDTGTLLMAGWLETAE